MSQTTAPVGVAVLVAGDANLDLVLTGDVVPRFGQAEQLLDAGELVLGGSAAIVAHGLARLGVDVRFVARVGDDAFGRITLDALRDAGVDLSPIDIDAHLATGLSVILSGPTDRAILTVPGTIPTLTAAAVITASAGAGHVHVASYFLQPDLAAELPTVLAGLQARGLTTSLDTNWDPAERWSGLADVLGHLDLLFPNLVELRSLGRALGGLTDLDDEDIAHSLASLGPRVVVKAGADGGWSVAEDGVVTRAEGVMIDVVDTTGAGDSFDAGYLAALAAGITDESVRLTWATTAGSLSTRAVGGTAAQPTRTELDATLRGR